MKTSPIDLIVTMLMAISVTLLVHYDKPEINSILVYVVTVMSFTFGRYIGYLVKIGYFNKESEYV